MKQYLVEHDTLGKLVDELLSQKYQGQSPEQLSEIRESSIQKLDDQIGDKVFGSLNSEQLKELDVLLDDPNTSPTVFQNFFDKSGVSLNQKITEAIQDFSREFLGGENA